jgi:hypothetical protein
MKLKLLTLDGFVLPLLASSCATELEFDRKAQHVSVKGEHAFMPPGPQDLRGPCPGLNALANQ